jgi:hypothetical protein
MYLPGWSVPLVTLLLCERPVAYTRTRITNLGLHLESALRIGMPDDSLEGVERVIGVKSEAGTFPPRRLGSGGETQPW